MEFEKNQSISTVRSHILTVTDDIRWWAIPTIFFDFLWFSLIYKKWTIVVYRRLSSIINDYKQSMKFEINQSISSVFSHILTVTDDIRWWAIPTIFFDFLWFTKMNHRRLSSIINDYKKSMKFEINQSISSVFSHILTVTDDIRWWAIAIRFLSLYKSMIIIDYHRRSSMIIYYQLPKWFAYPDDYRWSWWRCQQDRSWTAKSKAQSIDYFSKIERFRQ